MSRLFVVFAFIVTLILFSLNHAYADAPARQPDLLSLGLGYMDFDKTESHRQAADFRGEYRFGTSLLSSSLPYFRSWDNVVQFHPMLGIEVTTWNQLYAAGGFAMDAYLGGRFVFTWSENVGFLDNGEARRMGSFVEFRSMGELGYRFPNEMRLTIEASHISNAGMTHKNPGAEIAGIYWHIPINLMEKQH